MSGPRWPGHSPSTGSGPAARLRAVLALPRCALALLGAASVIVAAACLRVPGVAALAADPPWHGLVACPWRALTHLPCPGCGGTRAVLRLAVLDLPGAFLFNPLVTVTALAAMLLGALALLAPRATDALLARSGRFLATRPGRLALLAALLAEMAAVAIL
jgi:hypothetical protein